MMKNYRPWIDQSGDVSITPDTIQTPTIPQFLPAAATPTTPTVGQLLNAANAEYTIGGTPVGLTPFRVFGVQLSYTNDLDGVSARVWTTQAGQVVIAYQGTTGGDNIVLNPLAVASQLISDIGVFAQQTTLGEVDSLSFAKFVEGLAGMRGINSSNVFVTGHSLGGIEAEYVAQQTGLGGIGFESTGIPAAAHVGNGANFVDVVTYGDPVANYASDVAGEQPFAPAYSASGGALPHYGQVVRIGTASDQALLTQATAPYGDGDPAAQAGVVVSLAALVAEFHLPGVQAHDLAVSLSPYSITADSTGDRAGTVFSSSSDTIPQFLSSYAASHHGA